MDVTNMLLGQLPSFCSTGAMDECQELFPLFRSLAFSWSAEERDSWEHSRDLGVTRLCGSRAELYALELFFDSLFLYLPFLCS